MSLDDILNQEQVLALINMPRSTLYYFMNHEGFPKPIKLGTRIARWSKRSILEWYKNKGFEVEGLIK